MLLEYGNHPASDSWFVTEEVPTGYARVYYVHSGDVTYSDQYNTKKLKKNYVYILPTVTPYALIQNIKDKFSCTFVHLDFVTMFSSQLIEIEVSPETLIFNILKSLKYSIELNDIEIIQSIAQTFEIYCKNAGLLNYPPVQITSTIEFLVKNYKDQISISELSMKMGYNEQYFIRLFKKHMGISPYQYVMDLRYKEALRMLKLNYSIGEIAREVGYQDLKTFSRAFKQKYGVSPKKFIENFVLIP